MAPADAVEDQLVECIAVSTWRLRRLWRAEAGAIRLAQRRPRSFDKQGFAAAAVPYNLAQLSRYEVAIERLMQRAYVLLERRQARRSSGKHENYKTKPNSVAGSAG